MLAARRGGFLLQTCQGREIFHADTDEEAMERRGRIEMREFAGLIHNEHHPNIVVGVLENAFLLHGADCIADFLVEGEAGWRGFGMFGKYGGEIFLLSARNVPPGKARRRIADDLISGKKLFQPFAQLAVFRPHPADFFGIGGILALAFDAHPAEFFILPPYIGVCQPDFFGHLVCPTLLFGVFQQDFVYPPEGLLLLFMLFYQIPPQALDDNPVVFKR